MLAGLDSEPTVDITGAATALLALATTGLAWMTHKGVKASRSQVEISRSQMEHSHRPVIVPVQENVKIRFRGGEVHAASPTIHENDPERDDLPAYAHVILPIKNVGMGPALNIRGRLSQTDGDAYDVEKPLEGLGAGQVNAVLFARWQQARTGTAGLAEFTAELIYDDIGGRSYSTDVEWRSGPFAFSAKVST